MSWRKSIEEWRALTPEQQREIRHRRLPGKVARSMAFAGEPVDQTLLVAMLVCLTESRAKSRATPEERRETGHEANSSESRLRIARDASCLDPVMNHGREPGH